MSQIPPHYQFEKKMQEQFIAAVESLGRTLREQGPLDTKTAHLVQLAASIAIHSEGGVHSHVRQALDNGATPDEVRHAIILLTSTIGFPTVSAGLRLGGGYPGTSRQTAGITHGADLTGIDRLSRGDAICYFSRCRRVFRVFLDL